ncbi:hypothetical protein OG866_26945 [Streptomyces sp. NBC_00663]|uniref:hypothetical protein n=1 Tax=Streptomyces sp. NBC_00663 TaxID=2975801 RepID=UPI002E366670|nr:hypothetical protein [Streptomyces sp. NBC_00663]
MTASSQNPTGAQASELQPAPLMSDAERAAYAAYGVAIPAPAGPVAPQKLPAAYPDDVPFDLRVPFAEPQQAECCVCSSQEGALRTDPDERRYPSGAQVLFCLKHVPLSFTEAAAEALIAEALGRGDSARDTALSISGTGILFDPQAAADIAAAAAEQAHAEDQAELDERGRQLARMAGAERQRDAVARLLEGRPVTDFLSAAEVARAIEYGTTSLDAYPMTLTWTAKYGVDIPGPGDTSERAVIRCRSSHGQAADLIVKGDDRQALASLLGLEARDIHAECPTDGCGTVDDYDASDPSLFGWSRLQIAALGDEARWYCSDRCVIDALARAGHDFAEADRQAAVDPAQQGHAPAEDGAA